MYCFSMLQQFLGEDHGVTKSESSATYNLLLIIYYFVLCVSVIQGSLLIFGGYSLSSSK